MKNVTQSFKENIKKYGRQLNATILANETIMDSEQINGIYPSVNTSLFKSVMRVLELDSNVNIEKNNLVNCMTGISFNSPYEYISYPYYFTIAPSEKQEDTRSYKVLAYDRMVESMIDYDLNITNKITVRQYLLKICERLGWNAEHIPATFINSNKLVDPILHQGIGYKFRDVLDEIATITCSFLLFIDGEFYMKYITETNEIIDEEYLSDTDVSIGEKYLINSLVFSRAEESDNIYRKDDTSIAQNGLYEFRIADNQLLSTNDRADFIDDMFNYLKTIEFYTYDIKSTGIMFLDIADRFTLRCHGQDYSTIMLNDEISITQGLTERLYVDRPEETKTEYEYADSDDRKLNQTYILVNKQAQQITEIIENQTEFSSRLTSTESSLDGIDQRVQSLEDFTREKTETNQIHLTETIAGDGYITNFTIYGNTQYFVYLAPTPTLTPSPTLVPLGDHFTLVIDKQSRTAGKSAEAIELDVELAEPIRNIDDVCDEFRVIDGIVSVYRRIGVDDNNNLYVLETPTEEIIGALRIPTFDEDTYIYVEEYENLKYYAKYITKNDYSQYFTTKVQLSTAITETEKQILLMAQQKMDTSTAEALFRVMAENINSKVSKDGVCSEISQSADAIDIKGNRITIKSDFFELAEDGRIIATSGNIGGFELNPTSFSKNISGLYNYNSFDCVTILAYLRDHLNFDTNMSKIMDFNNDGEVTVLDIIKILNVLRGTEINTKNVSGTFEINSDDPKRCLIIKDQYGNEVLSLGLGGLNSQFISANQCIIGDLLANYNNSPYVAINGDTGNIYTTGTITQASLAEKKKNFKKLENALDIIKAIDIYKYNLQIENNDDKKHIGFVIGDEFKYSPDVTSKDNDGADIYSLASVCVKAIQEQQNEIDNLKQELAELKTLLKKGEK